MNIIPNLIDWREEYKRKRIPPKDYNYVDCFLKAQNNTQKLKLDNPKFKFNDNYSSEGIGSVSESIQDIINESVYTYSEKSISFNCFGFSFLTQKALK